MKKALALLLSLALLLPLAAVPALAAPATTPPASAFAGAYITDDAGKEAGKLDKVTGVLLDFVGDYDTLLESDFEARNLKVEFWANFAGGHAQSTAVTFKNIEKVTHSTDGITRFHVTLDKSFTAVGNYQITLPYKNNFLTDIYGYIGDPGNRSHVGGLGVYLEEQEGYARPARSFIVLGNHSTKSETYNTFDFTGDTGAFDIIVPEGSVTIPVGFHGYLPGFSIQPKSGLPAGNYEVEYTIGAPGVHTLEGNMIFTVLPRTTPVKTFTVTAPKVNLPVGYSSADWNPVTINNGTEDEAIITGITATGSVEARFDADSLPYTLEAGQEDATLVSYRAPDGLEPGSYNGVVAIDYHWAANPDVNCQYLLRLDYRVGGGGSNVDTGGGRGETPSTPPSLDSVTGKVTETVEKLKDAAAITADKLPAGVALGQTADGKTLATVPLALTSGSASLPAAFMGVLGAASDNVGLDLHIRANLSDPGVHVVIPGGFGKITEPGRYAYPMDYNPKAPEAAAMLAAVKTQGAKSQAVQLGAGFTLPVAATITLPTTLPQGAEVNIYKYNPDTRSCLSLGKATVKDGKLVFATKELGQLLLTTGTV